MNKMHMCVLLQIHTLGTYPPRCACGDKNNRPYGVGLVALVSGWGWYIPCGRKCHKHEFMMIMSFICSYTKKISPALHTLLVSPFVIRKYMLDAIMSLLVP